MELGKFFLMVEDFLEELFATGASSVFLSTAHLLLKSVQSAGLLFGLRKDFGASVEVTVDQLCLEQVVSLGLCHHFLICSLVRVEVLQDALS